MSSPSALLAFATANQLTPGAPRRAAISRAYYAAFHALQGPVDPMVEQEDRGRHGCAGHGVVLKCLRDWRTLHPDRKKALQHGADALKCFHLMRVCIDERERADYEMGLAGEVGPQEAVALVGKATRAVRYASKFT